MAKDTARESWRPAQALVDQCRAGEVIDFAALTAWWTADDTPAWLRTLPADVAVIVAASGVPHPDRWRGTGARAPHV